jgi:hypothetical protein
MGSVSSSSFKVHKTVVKLPKIQISNMAAQIDMLAQYIYI